jgi:hypothetical protein
MEAVTNSAGHLRHPPANRAADDAAAWPAIPDTAPQDIRPPLEEMPRPDRLSPRPGTLLGAAEIRRLAAQLDLRPTKSLGQNFVHDANTRRPGSTPTVPCSRSVRGWVR